MSSTLAPKRAGGYTRVSSVGQTGECSSSLETQEAGFNDYCQRLVCWVLPVLWILSPRVDMTGRSTTVPYTNSE